MYYPVERLRDIESRLREMHTECREIINAIPRCKDVGEEVYIASVESAVSKLQALGLDYDIVTTNLSTSESNSSAGEESNLCKRVSEKARLDYAGLISALNTYNDELNQFGKGEQNPNYSVKFFSKNDMHVAHNPDFHAKRIPM